MVSTTQQVTAQELLHMPNEDCRIELVKGEIKRMAPAGHHHGRIVMNISTPLHQFVRENKLGEIYAAETGFIISSNPDTVRAPDAAFVSRDRAKAFESQDGFFPGAPDAAVEVVSPNDVYSQVEEKVISWLQAGTKMVLVINPQLQTVSIYRSLHEIEVLTVTGYIDGGGVIPGWSFAVKELFV